MILEVAKGKNNQPFSKNSYVLNPYNQYKYISYRVHVEGYVILLSKVSLGLWNKS